MRAIYLDSSAFVKVVIDEPETNALRMYLSRNIGRRISSALLHAEAVRAVRDLGPEALRTIRAGLRLVDLIAIDDRILESAGTLEPRILRTLDAIHLASALMVGDDLDVIVTYDDRMIEAARMLGLPTAAPA